MKARALNQKAKLLLILNKDDPEVDNLIIKRRDLEFSAGNIEMNAWRKLRTIVQLEVELKQAYDDDDLKKKSGNLSTPEEIIERNWRMA